MFRITSEASRIRHLTNMHRIAIFERLQEDAEMFQECDPECMRRDPFRCSCGTYEATDTPLETIPADGYCDWAGEVYCGACGEMTTCIAPDGDSPRCFDCLDLADAVRCCDQWIPATLGHGAMCGYCGTTYVNSIRQ